MQNKMCVGGIAFSKLSFVKEKYGKEGLERMLKKMVELGYNGPMRIEEIKLGKWYPIEHNILFLKAYMDLFGERSFRRMAREVPNLTVSNSLAVSWPKNPKVIIMNAGELWRRFFNFGEMRGEIKGNEGRIIAKGISVDPILCTFLTEYFHGLMETSGAEGVMVKHTKCVHRGDEECEWIISWKNIRVNEERKIAWDDSLATGIEEIDRQHRYFVSILAELNDSLAGNYRDNLIRALHFMDKYAHWHFGSEEKYMEKYGYPDMENHKKQHELFYEYTRRVMDKARKGITPELWYEVNKYLVDWLISHIKGTDRKFAEFLISRNLSMPEEDMPSQIKENFGL